MKTQFFSYGGGLITGLFLFMLLPGLPESDLSFTEAGLINGTASARIQESRYKEVPIREFFGDVARYREQHLKKLGKPHKESKNELHSRLFTYNVETLEAFFVTVKDLAATANIPANEVAIRFYYGVYPLKTEIAKQNYSNLHTLFMVPNYWSQADKRYRDFDVKGLADTLKQLGGYGDHDKNPEAIIKKFYLEHMYSWNKNSAAYILDASAFDWLGAAKPQRASFLPSFREPPPVINQGQLCPPNCQAYSLIDFVDGNRAEFPGTP